ncbi:MAG: 50S ribosomal protein L25, partial [Proteobacteria bacterium]|nr:50S ribosomal protein L25 [Pseudomonadota bacterium]
FQRVKADQKLHVKVPLHFVNIEKSPAGKSAEATVTSELNDVEIVCLPANLPEFIEVDLGAIKPGDTVHLSDVKLPKGVELAHAIDDAHNPAVAVARTTKEEVVDDAAPEAAEVPSDKGSDAKSE